jgi:hypothetical protein
MDEIENKPVSAAADDSSDLREQIESLRHLVGSILILLVIVSGTLTIYLKRQVKTITDEVDGFRPGATNAIAIFQKQQKPAMEEFAKKIQQYGQTHPDFAPVLAKWDPVFVAWGWKLGASTGATPAAIAPTTVPPAAPRSNTNAKK